MSKNYYLDLENREHIIFLYQKFKNLISKSQSQVFYLYFFEDLSISDISKILATTRQSVNDSLKKSIIKLNQLNKKIK